MVMIPRRGDTKNRLMAAFIQLVVEKGIELATIQAIARQVGVTEGAVYRHYSSKEELRWQACKEIIEEMAREKEHLVIADMPIREKIRQWIKLTYAYFDRHPLGFTYVLLTPHPKFSQHAEEEILTWQGRIFMAMIEQAMSSGQARRMSPPMALCHFTGLMLNVPRLINEGLLDGPSLRYVDETTDAVWAVLKPIDPSAVKGKDDGTKNCHDATG